MAEVTRYKEKVGFTDDEDRGPGRKREVFGESSLKENTEGSTPPSTAGAAIAANPSDWSHAMSPFLRTELEHLHRLAPLFLLPRVPPRHWRRVMATRATVSTACRNIDFREENIPEPLSLERIDGDGTPAAETGSLEQRTANGSIRPDDSGGASKGVVTNEDPWCIEQQNTKGLLVDDVNDDGDALMSDPTSLNSTGSWESFGPARDAESRTSFPLSA